MPKHKRSVLKLDKRTGEVMERYDSTVEAGEANGLSRNSVWYLANNKKLTHHAYLLRYEDEYTGYEKFNSKYNAPVIVEDIKYDQLAWFSTIDEAAQKIMFARAALYKAIQNDSLVNNRFRIVSQIGFVGGKPILAHTLEV